MRKNKVKRYRKTRAYKHWFKIFVAGCILLFCGVALLGADFFLYQKKNEKEDQLKQLKQQEEEIHNAETFTVDSEVQESETGNSQPDEEGPSDENKIIKQLTQKIQSLDGDWSVYVEQFNTGIMCNIHQEKYPAASLIKLFIMGTVYEAYDELCREYGQEEVNGCLERMITVSDNEAANQLVAMLGYGSNEEGRSRVNLYCQENEYQDTNMGRMLLESNENGENYTSAIDCCEFLKKVYLNQCNHSLEMLRYLKQQERTDKIPAGVPDEVEVANKTGELNDVENDAALILDGDNTYCITVLASNLSDTSLAREKIKEISEEVYEYFKE